MIVGVIVARSGLAAVWVSVVTVTIVAAIIGMKGLVMLDWLASRWLTWMIIPTV
jgi:hypothetical protein